MKNTLDGGVQLVPGGGGEFEVWLNDQPVFSKRETDRFPEPDEVELAIGKAVVAGSGATLPAKSAKVAKSA